MPEGIEYYNDELFNSLLVPGRCHDCGADVGLTDVPAWTFCRRVRGPEATSRLSAAQPPPDITGRLLSERILELDRRLDGEPTGAADLLD